MSQKEVRRAPRWDYAHMCRDEHVQIGHNDSEHERCPLCRVKDEVARLTAERDYLQDELDTRKFDAVWTVEEHQRAVEAIQASEQMDANHYPSFQERVWWRASQQRAENAEADLEALRTRLRGLEQQWRETAPLSSIRAKANTLKICADELARLLTTPEEPT